MRYLLVILCLFPFTLCADMIGRSGGDVEYASLIGGSGNFAEEAFLTLLIAGFLFLISQWIKYAGRFKRLQALEVLPHLELGEMVPIYKVGKLRLVPESFEEYRDDFELFWSLEAVNSKILGRIGFSIIAHQKKPFN